MFTTHSDILSGTIWEQLKNGATSDYALYLPSKYELLDIHNNTCDGIHVDEQEHEQGTSPHTFNKNLGNLLSLSTDGYWSSSQSADPYSYYGSAFYGYFDYGNVVNDDMTNEYRSVALLHF